MDSQRLSETQENLLVMSINAGRFDALAQASAFRLSSEELAQLIALRLLVAPDARGMTALSEEGKRQAMKINERLMKEFQPNRRTQP